MTKYRTVELRNEKFGKTATNKIKADIFPSGRVLLTQVASVEKDIRVDIITLDKDDIKKLLKEVEESV